MRKRKMIVSGIPASVAAGATITVNVSGLVPGDQVGGGFNVPPNTSIPISSLENGAIHTASAQGTASWQWHILTTAPVSTYTWFIASSSGDMTQGNLQITAGSGIMDFIKKNAIWIAGGVLVLALFSRR